MKFFAIFLVVYVSPGCLSQCVNCAPQPTYQSPCCVPTSNVQTIQSARAFTNGAQGSQVIMYYNGQRVVSGGQQQPQGSNFNQANNYQNPGPIPGYQTGYDQNQNQNQTGNYPSNLNGGVVAGGATTGTVVVGGVTQQVTPGVNAGGNVGGPNQNINAGGVIGDPNQNQFQNNDPYQNQQNVGGVVGNQNQFQQQNQGYQDQNQYQNQNINAGGNFGDQNQNQFQNQNQNINAGGNFGDQNQNQFQNQDQNINVGGYINDQNQGQYQDQNNFQGSTLSPSGGEVGYQQFVQSGNTDYNINNNGAQGQFDQQGQQGQFQQNQNDQQVIYPAGGVAGGSYNSPNSGYVNSQVQPQTYPTQVVTGGAIPNQNVQQQPDVNTQYQDQMNQQNQQGGQPNNMQSGFVGSTTPQGFTSSPNNQFQSTQPGFNNQQQGFMTSTPGYQQGEFMTEGSGNEEFLGGQQQFAGQQNDGQQGYTDNTLTPPIENVQNENTQFTQDPSTQQFETTPTPFPVVYPNPGAGQTQQPISPQQTQFSTTQGTTPYPVIYPVPSAGQETQPPFQQTSTVSSNQDEFGVSSQNDAAFETTTPVFVPVPVPQNNGNVPLESSTTTVPVQNDSGTMPVTGTTPQRQFIGGVQQGSTNSFQSTTPTTTNFNNGQSSTGFQSTTGMPVTNDNTQSGFIAASTMDPNMPQAQYPSQQEILAATGQQADQSASGPMVSTQAPQFPSQQELGATLQNTQPTPAPQFPTQQDMGANQNFNGQQQNGFSSTPAGVNAQFPSQQELLARDQQNSGASGQTVNDSGFTPQYGDMNTQYGRYASSTAVKASSSPQFDQPTADQQQPQNSAVSNLNVLFATMFMIFMW